LKAFCLALKKKNLGNKETAQTVVVSFVRKKKVFFVFSLIFSPTNIEDGETEIGLFFCFTLFYL
jgi:hypothetical protein